MVENKIKDIIITRYGTLKNFCDKINVPYSTIDSILKRGIGKANVLNVIKICDELGLSVDALRHGIIESIDDEKYNIEQFLLELEHLLNKTSGLSAQDKEHLFTNAKFVCKRNDK